MNINRKIKIAFIKFGGMSAGGTERFLQNIAVNLPPHLFEVDYFYCDSCPYLGSDYIHPDTDINRLNFVQDGSVNLIKFRVGFKDVRKPTHDWIDTDFWQKFDPQKYDLVQTAKAGHPEYPFYKINLPVIEFVALSAGVDTSNNIAYSIHPSQWQRREWIAAGGNLKKSARIPVPAMLPVSRRNLRRTLKISPACLVAGFHQRVDDNIYSTIPLEAFKLIERESYHFIVMGGSEKYRKQALDLGLKNVHFLPHSSIDKDISVFLNTLDVFAHGRKDGETFGTVFAEAMMHGKPCLSHLSAIANAQIETIGPGGFVAKSMHDYAKKLKYLFDNDVDRNMFATKAQHHAKQYYSLASSVNKLLSIYENLFNKSIETPSETEYGLSDAGFLLSGCLEDEKSLSHYVLVGGVPNSFHLFVANFLATKINSFLGYGANSFLIASSLMADNEREVNIKFIDSGFRAGLNYTKTIELNNWEKKINIINISTEKHRFLPEISKIVDEFFDDLDFVSFDLSKLDIDFLKKIMSKMTNEGIFIITNRSSEEFSFKFEKHALEFLIYSGYNVYGHSEGFKLKRISMGAFWTKRNFSTYLCFRSDCNYFIHELINQYNNRSKYVMFK